MSQSTQPSQPLSPDYRPRISAPLTARRIARMLFAELFKEPADNSLENQEDSLLDALLLWPPDLFAYTSTVMSITGAYQLVVSPPSAQGDAALQAAIQVLNMDEYGKHVSVAQVREFFSWPPRVDVREYGQLQKRPDLEGNLEHPDENFLALILKHKPNDPDFKWKKAVEEIAFKWRERLESKFDIPTLQRFKHGERDKSDYIGQDKLPKEQSPEQRRQHTTDRLTQLKAMRDTESGWVQPEVLQIFTVLKSWFNRPPIENTNCSIGVFDLYSISDINCFDSDDDDEYRYNEKRFREELRGEAQAKAINAAALTHANHLANNWVALQSLITLHAIADAACVGLGTRRCAWDEWQEKYRSALATNDPKAARKTKASASSPKHQVTRFAEYRLRNFGTLSNIHEQLCRILPKRHTPELGITLRSLSSSISYHRSSIDVKWSLNNYEEKPLPPLGLSNFDNTESSVQKPVKNNLMRRLNTHHPRNPATLSVLLLPWPLEIKTSYFKALSPSKQQLAEQRMGKSLMNNKDGMYSYHPPTLGSDGQRALRTKLADALEKAIKEVGHVDLVVLPEGALCDDDVSELQKEFAQRDVSMYIAGVYRIPDEEKMDMPDNMVYFKMGSEQAGGMQYPGKAPKDGLQEGTGTFIPKPENYYTQYKHHRWKLDQAQVVNYGLGHRLSPTQNWWEAIKIRRRRVTFVNVGEELTICPLICEDLARQDPIADLIRTVGPSLVVTVLMDGPQRKDRWSSRYATVLAEDPGCAVLTLTSAGMIHRWKPPYITGSVVPVIALWNDGQGKIQEIILEPGSTGVVLSLTLGSKYESTLDGRKAIHRTSTLVLGGTYQVPEIR